MPAHIIHNCHLEVQIVWWMLITRFEAQNTSKRKVLDYRKFAQHLKGDKMKYKKNMKTQTPCKAFVLINTYLYLTCHYLQKPH